MLVIRFSRVGKKNRAQFRIVAQERTAAPSGKHIEILGSYDPHFKKGVFKKERIEHWVKNGAQISDSVYNVLISQGVIKGKKRFIKITAKKKKTQKNTEDSEKNTEVKGEEKKEKGESLVAPDPAKPEKTEEVKQENKKEDVKKEKTGEVKKEEKKKEVKKEREKGK